MSRVGLEGSALHCYTPYEKCCKANKRGEWFEVGEDGSQTVLPKRGEGKPLYRNRGEQIVRLNVRPVAGSSAAGLYRCCIPDSCGSERCVDVTLSL